MPTYARMTGSRLKLVFKRQAKPTWDAEYTPGILATRGEAPSISNASILMSQKLGRPVHGLSKSERAFILFGLYNPAALGLQEQRMLPGHSVPHPLATWPGADAVTLPPLKGLEEIAANLKIERFLHGISVTRRNGEQIKVTCPWFGDLLWLLRGSGDKIYCINWSIKDTQEAFQRRRKKIATSEQEPDEQAVARSAGERAYYRSASIPTYHLAREDFPLDLEANLLQLFLHHARPTTLTKAQQTELREKLLAALELGVPPSEIITRFRARHEVSVHEPRSFLFRMIWQRCLLVDLFRPLLIDRPMLPMARDPLVAFAHWFKPEGGAQ